MAFWSENFSKENSGLKDPKRKFRFRVSVGGFDAATGIIMWWAKTAQKPSFTIASAEHKYLNHTFYYPGSVTWNDVAITMVDPQDPDVARVLALLVQTGGYHPPLNSGDMSTMTKASASAALGTVQVTALDGAGNDIESWTLNNAWVTDLKFGDLEYGGDDLTEVSMTLKYDWATLEAAGPDAKDAAVWSKATGAPTEEPAE